MSTVLDEFNRRKAEFEQRRAATLAQASAEVSPDEAARRIRTAREYGVSEEVASAPEFTASQQLRDLSAAIGRRPRVGEWVRGSSSRAALARGSEQNLADIDELLASIRRPKSFDERAGMFIHETLGNNNPQGGNYIRDDLLNWRRVTRSLAAGTADLAASVAGGVEGLLDTNLEPGLLDFSINDAARALGFDPAASARNTRHEWEDAAFRMAPSASGDSGRSVLSGVRSLPTAGFAMLGGAYFGSAKLAAGIAGASAFGSSYGRGVDAGLTPEAASSYAMRDAAVETLTEFLPFDTLLRGVGSNFIARFGKSMFQDVLGEQAATFLQDMNAFMTLEQQKGATWDDFWASRGDAQFDTLVGSIIGSSAMGTASGAMEIAARRSGRRQTAAIEADAAERFVSSLNTLVAANTIIQRDPQSFAEFIDEAGGEMGAGNVYIEAEQLAQVLNQSGLTADEVAATTGLSVESIQQAVERGDDVSIPVSQYAVGVASTPLSDKLMPHLRLTPDGMSKAEAETYLQSAQEEFQRDAEMALDGSIDREERAASRQRVEEAVAAELASTGRFSDKVNQTYASIVGAFFATQGAKLGVSAEELAARYQLKVQAGAVAEPTFDQPAPRLPGNPGGRPIFAPAQEAARAYADGVGLPYTPPQVYSRVDPERARRIAQAFDEMQHDPTNPEVQAAYAALAAETMAQYEVVKATGLQIEFVEGEDPYGGNPFGAVDDVRENNHIWVFNTEDGYGRDGISDAERAVNPMLQVVPGEEWSGKPVLVNDVFRVVHDYFGHAKNGVGFRADGEENAWRAHSAMFSPLARRALTTETRGQNSWLNYGPHGDNNRRAKIEDTVFAEQKIGLLPQWAADEGLADPETFDQSAAPLMYLPLGVEGSGPGGRILNIDLGDALTLRHMNKYGRALDPTDPDDYKVVLASMLEDYDDQSMEDDNGLTWYSDDIAAALEVTMSILPELDIPVRRDIFLTVAALLSPQQGPVDNWDNAIHAMVGYSKTGRFALEKPSGASFGVASHATGLQLFQHLIDTKGEIGALVWLNDEHTGREMEAVRRASGLFQNKADNYLPSEMNFTEKKLGAYMFGPKVGDFMLNSTGLDASAVTVDLWMARTYNRLIGRLTDVSEKTRQKGGLADNMRGKSERAIVKRLVVDAAKEVGITPSAMQAALWYFEQRLYRKHGIHAGSTSFSDAARVAAETRGITVDRAVGEGRSTRGAEPTREDLEEGVVYNQSYINGSGVRDAAISAFRGESMHPSMATRHADGTVYVDVPPWYPDRLAKIAEQIGAPAVVAVEKDDPRLQEGVPLWHNKPPVNPDGTVTLHHWGQSPDMTRTDVSRWKSSKTMSRDEMNMGGPPRTFFGIASGQPGGYTVEFPYRTMYETRVPLARIYDIAKDPDGLKPAPSVPKLEFKIRDAGYAGYWVNNDQLGLVAVLFEDVDVWPATAQIMYQDAVFFSALERALENNTTQKASAAQWEATLRKTPGIKEEELEWTGVLEFLSMQEGPVTRDQLLELVRGAGIHVDEVLLGDTDKRPFAEQVKELTATGMSERDAEEVVYTRRENALPAKFANWTSDRDNPTYRELLFTLRIGEGRNPNRAPSTHWDQRGVIAHVRFMDKTDADGKKVLSVEEVQSDWHQKGRDQGYEAAPNPEALAKIEGARGRLEALDNELLALGRTTTELEQQLTASLEPDARAALAAFIDRLPAEDAGSEGVNDIVSQSMRRSTGVAFYESGGAGEGYVGHRDLLGWAAAIQRFTNLSAENERLVDALGEVIDRRGSLTQQIHLAEMELRVAEEAVNKGIPNAPFRTEWPALVMKRMIRWAAEHGYERIAWTTGEQQAKRYNLTNAVRQLDYRLEEDGRVRVSPTNSAAYAALQQQGEAAPGGMTLFTREQAKAAFGESIAAKLFAESEAVPDSQGYRRLEGVDLDVGGEGMQAFYDRNLVNITNKLVKKYGAKVGPVRVVEPRMEEIAATPAALRADADAMAGVDGRMAEALYTRANEIEADPRVSQTQPGFDITPALADAAMGGFPLFQRERGPRGQIAFGADVTKTPSVITLLRGADLSTFVHELGHFFFEVTNHMASQAGAPPEIVADRDAMLRYLGVESVTEWENRTPAQRREGHERIARSFEAYLFEGKAPSIELRGVFTKLRSWMMQVYRKITALNVQLTDEVRGVFDRMLASEDAIRDAELDTELRPMFADKPEGMTDADWEEYQMLNADATEEAAKRLESRSLRDMRYAGKAIARELKRLQAEVADQRAAMREEVAAEFAEKPIYKAINLFRKNELDGQPFEVEAKLNIEVVREALQLGDDPIPDALRGMTAEGGLHPQQAAELLGFTSADHMLKDLLFASPFDEAVDAETDARMRERYGEVNDPTDVEEAARAAVHNEVRGRFVATELAALQNAPGKKRVLNAAARRMAEDMVARLRIRDLRPGQYEVAERRAARAAQAAGATNLEEATRQKRNQLLQFNLARAAHEARDEVKAARDYLTKFNNKNTRANIDPDFLDQIDQLLERYELRPVSNKEADRRKDLRAWIEKMQAEGFEPAIDPAVLAEIGRKPWRELTVEEMRGLLDAVRNVEHLGRLSKKLLTAKDKADLDAAATEMGETVRVNAAQTVDPVIGAKTWWELVKSGAKDFFAMHRKMANMVHVFDGNQYGGVFWERFIRPMNEAGDRETTMTREANLRLAALFTPILEENTHKREHIPEIEKSLSLEDRLMVALNMGNEANLQRMMSGDRWSYEQVLAIVAPLKAHHWDFVEKVWAEIGSWWPQIAAKEKRVTGIEPERVEALPFQIEVDGALRYIPGGYFPIKYDPDRSSRAEADERAEVLKQMTRGLYTSAQTRRGHTKARAEQVNNRPVRKDFGVIFGHVNQVIHDLAWHEYLIDANRLLRHASVDSAIREHYGPEALRWMRKALEDIAVGDLGAMTAFEKGVRHLRAGVSISAMGWSVWTSLLQPTGLSQSVARIGVKHVAKGIGALFASPKAINEKVEWIYSVSPFMRDRGLTQQREINEVRNHIGPKSPLRETVGKVVPPAMISTVTDSFFVLITKAQLLADLPTWLGQYEKSMGEGVDQDTAVAIADQAVIDSQGGGTIKDLAAIQRGGELQKLFTNFYSYFASTYNLMADRTNQFKRIGRADLPYYLVDMSLLTFVPATIASIMYQTLRTDEDDPWEFIKQVGVDNATYLMGLMVGVREVGGTLSGVAGYQGPAGTRFFAELGRFGKQVNQGEADEALARAANSTAGILLHYPATQLDRTARGAIALSKGEDDPSAVILGPEVKR